MRLPPAAEALTWLRLAMYAALFVPVVTRRRAWPLAIVGTLGIVSSVLFLEGLLNASGAFGVPLVAAWTWVAVLWLREHPHALKARLAVKEAEWSRSRHDLFEAISLLKAESSLLRREAERGGDVAKVPRIDVDPILDKVRKRSGT